MENIRVIRITHPTESYLALTGKPINLFDNAPTRLIMPGEKCAIGHTEQEAIQELQKKLQPTS